MSLLQNKEILRTLHSTHVPRLIRYIHVPHLYEADEKSHRSKVAPALLSAMFEGIETAALVI